MIEKILSKLILYLDNSGIDPSAGSPAAEEIKGISKNRTIVSADLSIFDKLRFAVKDNILMLSDEVHKDDADRFF